ncbi:MAG: YadA-like family protein, partial [Burkholderia sp.]|uniref:YadA family autotransporter adhesin n=1 Tax=Burkholderia sp. TaxID=36773 RepID=UPI0028299B86
DLKDKLADSGLVDPSTGKAIAAVTYDNATKSSVTLGGTGSTTPVALKNVATGIDGTDAVNVSQLTSGLTDLREDLTNGAIDLRFIKVNADQKTAAAAIVTGAQAVAIGSGAAGTGAHALALGTGARASGLDSVAIGYNSVANQANTVSVGSVGNERRIVNVGNGNVAFESKDAINGGQLFDAMSSLTTSVNTTTQAAIDSFSSSLEQKTQAAIDQANARSMQLMDATDPLVAIDGHTGDNYASLNGAPSTSTAVAIGSQSSALGGNTVAVGLSSVAGSDNSVAIGSSAQTGAGQAYSVAMGSEAFTNGTQAVALGAKVQANADRAVAVGNNDTWALGTSSIAMGDGAKANVGAANAIAVGTGSTVSANVTNAIAIGANANVAAGANGGIALGAGSIANRGNALSIGSVGAERQIVNVAAGTAQTDAVNVSQLAGVTKALGGSAAVGADGSITQPTYTIDGKTYSNVSDALAAAAASGGGGTPADGTVAYDDAAKTSVTLGGVGAATPVALKNVADGKDDHDAVNVSQLKSSGLVGDDGSGNLTSLAVAYDDATKSGVTLGGTGATSAVALKNVAAGAVNATSNDAINGSQLFGTAQSVAASLGGGATVGADGTITQPTFNVGGTDVHTVGDALTNLDGRVTGNTGDIADLRKQLGNTGLVDTGTGQTLAAVTYDVDPTTGATNRGSVTLGGASATAPVALKNVADGKDDHDAVNVSQLKSTGLVGDDGSGNLTSLAVGYDDATKDAITLGGANGTTITNVAAGAVNATSTDAINGSQLHGTAQSVADTLGGGVTVNADGTVSKASFLVNGDRYATVEDALTAASKSGATDSLAVKYDNVDHTRVSLGGTGAPAPVVLTNVANGTTTYDAVNYGQLSDLQSELNDKLGSMDGRVGKLEAGVLPGDGSGSGSGSDLIGGTGGDGGTIIPANPGTGTGNVAIGSGAAVADGANNGTAIGSGSNVDGTGGTAIGSGSKAADAGSTAIGQGSSVAAGAGNSVAIGQGSVATESNTVSFGSSGNERRLVNVADGINATDAATKGQLDRAMGGMQNQVNDLSRNAYSGIAAATALTMIPGVDPDKTISFGIGGATYKGYQAVAFGGEARITQNLKMKAGVGMSSGGNTVGVGASYQW